MFCFIYCKINLLFFFILFYFITGCRRIINMSVNSSDTCRYASPAEERPRNKSEAVVDGVVGGVVVGGSGAVAATQIGSRSCIKF